MKKKAVFIRLDKIGDLICTLPVDQVEALHDWDITWVISKGLSFVPEHSVPKRQYLELDKTNPTEARQQLEAFLKTHQPEVAVSFQAPWWVNFALWKNKIPSRIGVLSKWHSFIFLNTGLRQKRSQAVKHEADYNLDLVRQIRNEQVNEATAPILRLKAQPQPELLAQFKLTPQAYMVVHPGMAGSALNWPTGHYIKLIENLASQHPVVLTGTPADEVWLSEIKNYFKDNPQVRCLQNQLNTRQLLYLLEQAKAVFAPSTGVLHLAASLGTAVFGFYSLIRVQTVTRWAARGPKVRLFSPPPPGNMEDITPEQILKALS